TESLHELLLKSMPNSQGSVGVPLSSSTPPSSTSKPHLVPPSPATQSPKASLPPIPSMGPPSLPSLSKGDDLSLSGKRGRGRPPGGAKGEDPTARKRSKTLQNLLKKS
ncbi:MAG: hypothetical protein Q8P67_21585, partial [archaeon]|nr:hypothetical protein [archaeon]